MEQQKFRSSSMESESHQHVEQQRQDSRGGGRGLPHATYCQSRPGAQHHLQQRNSAGKLKLQEKEASRSSRGEAFSTKGKTRSQPNMEGSAGRGVDRLRPSYPHSSSALHEESPDHSHHNSWAIDEEEDPDLRIEFPEVEGHLFSLTLKKGNGGLGLNIVSETSAKAVQGIVIMGIQAGGVADQCGRVRWGDVILKMNNVNVVGMSQEQFQKLLVQAPPTVTFVLLRQHADSSAHVDQSGSSRPQQVRHMELVHVQGCVSP